MSAVSSSFRAHFGMHSWKSAISLSLKLLLLLCQPRLARNQYSGLKLGPTHASLRSRTAIMITTSNSPVKRSGTPNQLLGVRRHTIAISGLSRVRTELFQLLVIPFLAHHPEQLHSQAAGHSNFRKLPSAPQHQMKIFAAPLRQAAHRHLRRLHQQETHDRTALLGDVSQAPALPAGVFQRHQSQITRHLFAAAKAFRVAEDEHK